MNNYSSNIMDKGEPSSPMLTQSQKRNIIDGEDELAKLVRDLESPEMIDEINQKLMLTGHNNSNNISPSLNSSMNYSNTLSHSIVSRDLNSSGKSLNYTYELESNNSDSCPGTPQSDPANGRNVPPHLRLMKEFSLDALKPVSENSPLHHSSTRPLSFMQRLPRLSIAEDDYDLSSDSSDSVDDSSSDSSSDSTESADLESVVTSPDLTPELQSTAPTDTTIPTIPVGLQFRSPSISNEMPPIHLSKERKRSILQSLEASPDGKLNSSSRLPSQRTGSIRIKESQSIEEDLILEKEFVEQERRSSIILNSSGNQISLHKSTNNTANNTEDSDSENTLSSSSSASIPPLSLQPFRLSLRRSVSENHAARLSLTLANAPSIQESIEKQIKEEAQQQQQQQQQELEQQEIKVTTNETITITIQDEEQKQEYKQHLQEMQDQVLLHLKALESPRDAATLAQDLNKISGEDSSIPMTNTEKIANGIDLLEPSAAYQNKQLHRIVGRPRKESIAERWDIGRKIEVQPQPRRSLSLNFQRHGEEFNVSRPTIVKKANVELEKMLVHISMVDQSHKVICITEDFLVQDVITLYAEKLGLVQIEFFSLAEHTSDGCDRWLDPNKFVKDVGIKNLSKLVFKIKFFKQPKRLSDSKAVHLYYLQVQQSVVNGIYPCSEAMSFRLSALQFYITFGPYDKEKHITGFLDHGSLSEFIPAAFFFELSDEVLQKRLFKLHSQIKCSTIIEAKLRYLDLANKIPTFGVTSFQVHDGVREDSITRHKRNLCVAEDGILISRKDRAGYDFFHYKNILSYTVTARGLKIQIPFPCVTPNTSENMSFDCVSYEQSNNIVELMNGYKCFGKHEDYIKGLGPAPVNVDVNISILFPLFQAPKVRTKSDPFRSRLELFKLNYLTLCLNFHSKPIGKLIDQIDEVLDKEGSFRVNNSVYESIELHSLHLRGSDLSFIADALKDTLNTPIEEGESIIENLNIVKLDLSNNPVLASDAFEPLKIIMTCNTIQHLNLKNIGLSNKGVMPLITILEKYPLIQSLQVGKNRLNESGIRLILRAIKNYNTCIDTLGFDETNLTDIGCGTIEKLLSKNKTLTSLNIAKNKITENGFKLIFEGIKQNTNLSELNLSNNQIQTKQINKFIKWLSTNNTNIIKLNIASTGLSSSSGSEMQKLLVSNGCHVRNLDISYNNLGTSGTKNVIKGIVHNHTVQELTLSANKINFSGVNDLCQVLELSASCIKLYLRYCELGSKSLIRIAKMLEENNTLTTLDLSMNELSKSAAIILASALTKNTNLEDLHLTQCRLGHKELEMIAKGIAKNQSLKRLYLDVNPIGKRGLQCLVEAINENSVLEVLTLRNTNIHGKDIAEFLKKLNTNTHIKTINLSENLLTNLSLTTKHTITENIKRLYHISIHY
ncbi:hypothetical protein CYY_002761 [Polysphondylium violaceum]|uniref:FERM domain-containing protein n=1 Tax=Polysphondylium violaceum TaxID=133409 RepID=A0A8J4V1Y5_9MYCE|nr:hypothetical protein CYY_002761 [Polysphondylium violaceum]